MANSLIICTSFPIFGIIVSIIHIVLAHMKKDDWSEAEKKKANGLKSCLVDTPQGFLSLITLCFVATNRHCLGPNWYISTYIVLLWISSFFLVCSLTLLTIGILAMVAGKVAEEVLED